MSFTDLFILKKKRPKSFIKDGRLLEPKKIIYTTRIKQTSPKPKFKSQKNIYLLLKMPES